MAEDSQKPTTDSKPAGKTVTIHRVQIGLNVVIQVIVVILIVGMVRTSSPTGWRAAVRSDGVPPFSNVTRRA